MRASELAREVAAAGGHEQFSPVFGCNAVLVEIDTDVQLASLPCPVLAITGQMGAGADAAGLPDYVDVGVPDAAAAERVMACIDASPQAASVLVRLLRHNARASVADGLLAESLAYSTLQSGAEFGRWLGGRTRRSSAPATAAPVVLLERVDDELHVLLNRPEKRNAYSAAVRDALCEALAVLTADASIRQAVLRGAGACFSAGGDLDEFGTLPDPASGHLIRSTRSAGALIDAQRSRMVCRLHGACVGAGIELPAFAGRVEAAADSFFMLPEVAMGLIPGAGGTVSITRRIGRRRCAWMALTGDRIGPPTALAWGLIDAIV